MRQFKYRIIIKSGQELEPGNIVVMVHSKLTKHGATWPTSVVLVNREEMNAPVDKYNQSWCDIECEADLSMVLARWLGEDVHTHNALPIGSLLWFNNGVTTALPRAFRQEQALMNIRDSLDRYARGHYETTGAHISQDYVLGPEWLRILSATRALLNGECGDIDCGDFTNSLTAMRNKYGFTQNNEDES